jgi:anthranilate 1,2-dioxygenase large subunit
MSVDSLAPSSSPSRHWPEGLTRIPYWVYQDPAIYATEQRALFMGPHWSYLCLEAELPNSGDFVSTYIGETPVVITRDANGAYHAFENRCAHRGAMLCLEDRGNAKAFTCVYHAWTYDLEGTLRGIAFKDGIGGKGGMPATFDMSEHGPRKLRVEHVHGLLFGTFDETTPPLETYLGPMILERIARVMNGRKPVVLGRYTQMLPYNWKLYVENVKDSYHASILHTFFTTFKINRLNQRGEILVDESGGHHVSYSAIDRAADENAQYRDAQLRSDNSRLRLNDASILNLFEEFADDISLQILSVFPGFVLQQIQNAIAVRQVLPRGIEQTELNWIILGFDTDTSEQRIARLKQGNLVGPAGYVSMEDGCVGGFVQRAVAGASDEVSVVEMGGSGAESSESRVTEASVRGFWKAYRAAVGL